MFLPNNFMGVECGHDLSFRSLQLLAELKVERNLLYLRVLSFKRQ